MSEEFSTIRSFYTNKGVFITGATGFLGKVLLEKVLRSLPVDQVFILVRGKKDETPAQRVESLLAGPLFDRLRKEKPDFVSKITPVIGDIMHPHFGLSQKDLNLLRSRASIAIHCAATVSFNEKLRLALQMNVVAVQRLVAICKSFQKLDAIVHVSTAYANCDRLRILEQVYPPCVDPYKLIEATTWLDDDQLEGLTSSLLGRRPNTYTMTKSLGEYVLCREGQNLPVSIFRPSIVGATYNEPLPGWQDNLNGPGGLYLACGKGVLRVMKGDVNAKADIIPVDFCANMLIAIAWRTARLYYERKQQELFESSLHTSLPSSSSSSSSTSSTSSTSNKKNNNHDSLILVHAPKQSESLINIPSALHLSEGSEGSEETGLELSISKSNGSGDENDVPLESHALVYHCTSGDINPLYWRYNNIVVAAAFHNYPLEKVFRRPNFAHVNNERVFQFWNVVSHVIPAYLADFASVLSGQRPRMRKIYGKLEKLMDAYNFFTTRDWSWEQRNSLAVLAELPPSELELFNFDVKTLNWKSYLEMYAIGIKKFILKEDMSRINIARQQHRRLRAVRVLCTISILFFVLRVIFRFLRNRGFVKGSWTMIMNPFSFIMLSMKTQALQLAGKSY